MTLKEEFKRWLDTNPRLEIREVQLEEIADDYAIEFAEWCDNEGYTQVNNLSLWKSLDDEQGKYSKELLEIFKKENGL